jgi:hypothetical protein
MFETRLFKNKIYKNVNRFVLGGKHWQDSDRQRERDATWRPGDASAARRAARSTLRSGGASHTVMAKELEQAPVHQVTALQVDTSYFTLMKACHEGRIDTVRELWSACSQYGHWLFSFTSGVMDGMAWQAYENLLHSAAREGHRDVVEFLLREMTGEDSSTALTTFMRTPLLLACQGGHLECAKLLGIDNPHILNREDAYEQTPFHAACLAGNAPLIELLYNNGAADINKSAHVGMESGDAFITPFVAVLLSKSTEAITCMLNLKAVDLVTPAQTISGPACKFDGQTPAEIAVHLRLDVELVSLINDRISKHKRKRSTPVKKRAAKAGVELPPTPAGVRECIQMGSPGEKKAAAQDLQKHQTYCRKKVDKAEKATQVPLTFTQLLNAERLRAKNRHKEAKSREKLSANDEESRDEGSDDDDVRFGPRLLQIQTICPYSDKADPPSRVIMGGALPAWCERWAPG